MDIYNRIHKIPSITVHVLHIQQLQHNLLEKAYNSFIIIIFIIEHVPFAELEGFAIAMYYYINQMPWRHTSIVPMRIPLSILLVSRLPFLCQHLQATHAITYACMCILMTLFCVLICILKKTFRQMNIAYKYMN